MGRNKNTSYRGHEYRNFLQTTVNGRYEQVRGLVYYIVMLVHCELVSEYILIARYMRQTVIQKTLQRVQTVITVRKRQAVYLLTGRYLSSAKDIRLPSTVEIEGSSNG